MGWLVGWLASGWVGGLVGWLAAWQAGGWMGGWVGGWWVGGFVRSAGRSVGWLVCGKLQLFVFQHVAGGHEPLNLPAPQGWMALNLRNDVLESAALQNGSPWLFCFGDCSDPLLGLNLLCVAIWDARRADESGCHD